MYFFQLRFSFCDGKAYCYIVPFVISQSLFSFWTVLSSQKQIVIRKQQVIEPSSELINSKREVK